MDCDVLGEDLDLDEVLICLEEGELLEEALPCYTVSLFVLHDVLGYFHCLFEFSHHHIAGGQAHVVSRIHRRESRGDDRKVVLFVLLVEEGFVYGELDHLWVVQYFTQGDWVVILPLAVAVVTEEGVKKLADFKIWVHFADVGHQDSICDTTAVTHDIRVDASVLGPKLDASES